MLQVEAYTLFTVLIADLLATSGDIAATWTSPVFPKLHSNDPSVNPLPRPTTSDEDSWIGSLITLGAILGSFPFGFISEKFGRKIALLSIAIPHIIAYLTLAFSKQVYLYFFARFLTGIGIGGGYAILPTYIAEVSQDSNRGLLSSSLNIFWTFGNLMPYVLGPYLPMMWFNLILLCVPIVFFLAFWLVAPESPYFLIAKNKMVEAKQSLTKLRSGNEELIESEIRQIKKELQENNDQTTFLEFLQNKIYLKALFISLVLIVSQQLSGIEAILFYTEHIFELAGANGLAPEISSMIIGFVIFGSSFLIPSVVDKWGRKILLIASLLGITVSHAAFGVYFYFQSLNYDVSSISWLPITSLVLYLVSFNCGSGPLPWTISSELFPTNVKSYGASLTSSTCWAASFFVSKFFTDLTAKLGEYGTFWLFGGSAFLSFIFTIIYVPETKGKSFQEIQGILGHLTIKGFCVKPLSVITKLTSYLF